MDDLLEDFIAETRETLETLSSELVQWERTPQDRTLIDSVFRFVHTVKGSCGFLDLPRLLRLSHAAEDLLSAARDGLVTASPTLVSAVLAVIDRISALTDALETGQAVHDNDEELIETMLAFLPGDLEGSEEDVFQSVFDDAADNLHDEHETKVRNRTVRISLNLLDKLMNGVSDMVLARNEVSRQLRRVGGNSEVEHAFGRLSASVAEMRDAVSLMRMQNIERLFSSLPRLMRDINIELGKEIDLQIEGSEVEVDREMVEALRDPLTHILRNAADHGIESAEERRLGGKDPVGNIRVSARQSGNQILIEVIDDGRGINVEKLGGRAIAAKLVTAAEWQKFSAKAQLDMIFTPGLSTADKVSAISGRGVGMDVVRNNVQAIGGSIDLENVEGRGLKMTLRMPLTLSIIAGLSVRAGTQIFGISRNSVVEIISASNSNVEISDLGGAKIAMVRGERFPYATLELLLEIDAVALPGDTSRTLIIMRPARGMTYVLDVAAVIDNEELVVKPGAPLLMATGLYAGTSLPDNGRPMLLLDASGLGAIIGISDQQERHVEAKVAMASEACPSALLFVAMDGNKRAIRLAAIDRMEDIDVANIKFVGGKMRAVQGSHLTEICDLSVIPESGFVKLLRLSGGNESKFLAVEDVLDIFSMEGAISPTANRELHEGVIHAFGEPVELVNVFHYFDDIEIAAPSNDQPLCFVDCGGDAHWERGILAPLLSASGYRVSFNESDRAAASIVIRPETDGTEDTEEVQDARIVRLRDNLRGSAAAPSIYRYDRIGLISAIQSKLAGAGQ